jgi:hypothetical protein
VDESWGYWKSTTVGIRLSTYLETPFSRYAAAVRNRTCLFWLLDLKNNYSIAKKESVMRVEDVKREMKATGQFNDAELANLTQEIVDRGLKNSTALPTGAYPEDARPAYTTWTGNNFRIVSGKWYWDDTPGSMCGRTRTWNYQPASGASYRQAGTCSQGYAWYEMNIP